MHSQKPFYFLLITLFLVSNVASFCPPKQGMPGSIHLAFDSCEATECKGNQEAHSCEMEKCSHAVCVDEPVIEVCRLPRREHIVFDCFTCSIVFVNLHKYQPNQITLFQNKGLLPLSSHNLLSTVLRI